MLRTLVGDEIPAFYTIPELGIDYAPKHRLMVTNRGDKSRNLSPSYPTVANGWSDDIIVEPGEALLQVVPGSATHFAQYLVGPIQEVLGWAESH